MSTWAKHVVFNVVIGGEQHILLTVYKSNIICWTLINIVVIIIVFQQMWQAHKTSLYITPNFKAGTRKYDMLIWGAETDKNIHVINRRSSSLKRYVH